MELRPGIRLIYQIGRVVVQTSALFLDLDDLSGGRITRMFVKERARRKPKPPPTSQYTPQNKQVYGASRGVPFHRPRKTMPKR